jgi:Holliday junction resolvasome RuvABC DNA-binding subunit
VSPVETTPSQPAESPEENEEEQAARVALEKLGYLDKKGVEAMLKHALESQKMESAEKEHSTAITEFYRSRPDISQDTNRKQILEKYVIDNFNITPNTSKKQLAANLDMAAMYLFPRVSKSNPVEAANKRSIVNTTSNTKVASSDNSMYSQLKAAGYSDDEIKNSGW